MVDTVIQEMAHPAAASVLKDIAEAYRCASDQRGRRELLLKAALETLQDLEREQRVAITADTIAHLRRTVLQAW